MPRAAGCHARTIHRASEKFQRRPGRLSDSGFSGFQPPSPLLELSSKRGNMQGPSASGTGPSRQIAPMPSRLFARVPRCLQLGSRYVLVGVFAIPILVVLGVLLGREIAREMKRAF